MSAKITVDFTGLSSAALQNMAAQFEQAGQANVANALDHAAKRISALGL